MPGHHHRTVAAPGYDEETGRPVATEEPRGELRGRGAGEEEIQILVAHLHDVGAGGGPLRGGGHLAAVRRDRRPGVGVVTGDHVTAAAYGFSKPQHLLAAGSERHAERADVQ